MFPRENSWKSSCWGTRELVSDENVAGSSSTRLTSAWRKTCHTPCSSRLTGSVVSICWYHANTGSAGSSTVVPRDWKDVGSDMGRPALDDRDAGARRRPPASLPLLPAVQQGSRLAHRRELGRPGGDCARRTSVPSRLAPEGRYDEARSVSML